MKHIKEAIINCALAQYKLIIFGVILAVCIAGIFLPRVQMDTDPENMLMQSETRTNISQ